MLHRSATWHRRYGRGMVGGGCREIVFATENPIENVSGKHEVMLGIFSSFSKLHRIFSVIIKFFAVTGTENRDLGTGGAEKFPIVDADFELSQREKT